MILLLIHYYYQCCYYYYHHHYYQYRYFYLKHLALKAGQLRQAGPSLESQGSVRYWPKRALFWKKGHQKFHHPLFNPFLSLLHQNKALHNFLKRGKCLITGHIIGLDQSLASPQAWQSSCRTVYVVLLDTRSKKYSWAM